MPPKKDGFVSAFTRAQQGRIGGGGAPAAPGPGPGPAASDEPDEELPVPAADAPVPMLERQSVVTAAVKNVRQTVWMPPDLQLWVRIRAATDRCDISVVVVAALEEYRLTHPS